MTTWKKVAEMVSCRNICNLTTKPTSTFEPKHLAFTLQICQKTELQFFIFQKVLMWLGFLTNQLGRFEYNFSCLKWFSSNLPRKLRSAFLPKLRFLKIQLSGRWIKCLLQRPYHHALAHRLTWALWIHFGQIS